MTRVMANDNDSELNCLLYTQVDLTHDLSLCSDDGMDDIALNERYAFY